MISLERNQSLANVDLSSNGIGVDGAVAIGKALETNTSLTEIGLSSNECGAAGEIAIMKALETNLSLKTIRLAKNRFGDAKAIGRALERNSCLTTIDISGNDLEFPGELIRKILESNKSLTSICMEGTVIGEAGAVGMLEALQTNQILTNITLDSRGISSGTMQALTELMKSRNGYIRSRTLMTREVRIVFIELL